PYDILLNGPAITHMGHIAQMDCPRPHLPDGNTVQGLDCGRRGVGADDILLITDLGVTRGKREALRVNCVHDIVWRNTRSPQCLRVEIDHNLPVLSTVWRRQRYALDRCEHLTKAVDPIVVKLLLVHTV